MFLDVCFKHPLVASFWRKRNRNTQKGKKNKKQNMLVNKKKKWKCRCLSNSMSMWVIFQLNTTAVWVSHQTPFVEAQLRWSESGSIGNKVRKLGVFFFFYTRNPRRITQYKLLWLLPSVPVVIEDLQAGPPYLKPCSGSVDWFDPYGSWSPAAKRKRKDHVTPEQPSGSSILSMQREER